MKIKYLLKEGIHLYPPCLSQILSLKDLGVNIEVYHGITDKNTIKILESHDIIHYELYKHEIKSNNGLALKIKRWRSYRAKALEIMKKNNNHEILWFGTADSAIAVYDKLKNKKYVLNILELYDKNKFYKKYLGKIVDGAKAIICCEYNRANIMKSWWNLKKVPYVIPNKPYLINIDEKQEKEEITNQIKNKKVILYQGMIAGDRSLINLAKALNNINDKQYWLVLMGNNYNNSVEKIKHIYKNTIYLGYIAAPTHLLYTKYAYMGVANYDYSCLNNIFCAPNKIYEYTGFGIPVLCNDVPGLHYTIGKTLAGKCVDFNSVSKIEQGIKEIEDNYMEFSKNATTFYESTDNIKTYKEILKDLGET